MMASRRRGTAMRKIWAMCQRLPGGLWKCEQPDETWTIVENIFDINCQSMEGQEGFGMFTIWEIWDREDDADTMILTRWCWWKGTWETEDKEDGRRGRGAVRRGGGGGSDHREGRGSTSSIPWFETFLLRWLLTYQESGHWSHFRSDLIWVELDDGVSLKEDNSFCQRLELD